MRNDLFDLSLRLFNNFIVSIILAFQKVLIELWSLQDFSEMKQKSPPRLLSWRFNHPNPTQIQEVVSNSCPNYKKISCMSFHSKWNFWKYFIANVKIFTAPICCEMTEYSIKYIHFSDLLLWWHLFLFQLYSAWRNLFQARDHPLLIWFYHSVAHTWAHQLN